MCRCPQEAEDLVYANRVALRHCDSIPDGYKITKPCIYPTANMKHMQNGAYMDIPMPGGEIPPPMPNDPKLKGNLSWVDPRGEAMDAARRKFSFAENPDKGVSDIAWCVSLFPLPNE